jgi:hypothetical protein
MSLLVFSVLSYSQAVAARDCYVKSPNLEKLQDEYFNLETNTVITDEDKAAMEKIFKIIDGKLEGESKSTECKGPDRAPRKEYSSSVMTADARLTSDSDLAISATKNYTQNKMIRHENLILPGNMRIFEIEILNDNGVTLSERSRRMNANDASRLVETIYEIIIDENSVTLTRSYYTNGVFVGDEVWSMVAK